MAHRPRSEMIAETRAKLVAAARQAFGTVGYAEASMDDFTAAAGLTRGALYHHFGDKKGLLEAVIAEIDAEMADRLCADLGQGEDRWQGFVDECTAYIEMALEPEIQRIVLRDGPAVLGDPSQWPKPERLHRLHDQEPDQARRRRASSSTSIRRRPRAWSAARRCTRRSGSPTPKTRRRRRRRR